VPADVRRQMFGATICVVMNGLFDVQLYVRFAPFRFAEGVSVMSVCAPLFMSATGSGADVTVVLFGSAGARPIIVLTVDRPLPFASEPMARMMSPFASAWVAN